MASSEARRTTRAADRLRRLLQFVPYIVQHPGVELEEVARLFDAAEDDLASDLDLLFVSGLPPYGPGDLIDVDVQDGRVWIRMADYFARPLRLTRAEASSLYLRGKALLATPGLAEAPALESALAKLEEGLGPEALGELAGRVEAVPAGPPAETLDAVREAAARHDRLEIEYFAASTQRTSERRIDPEEVFAAIGNWYVVAWDAGADAERMSRADRIRRVRRTGERFEPRGLRGVGRPLYTPTERDVRVRLLLRPGARWVAEYYETESLAERGEDLEAILPTRQLAWVAKLLVRLGGEAEALDPPQLRDLVRATAEETLARYGEVGDGPRKKA